MKRWSHRGALATALLGTLVGSVASADDTGDLAVTATVEASCQLNVIPVLDFGILNPLADNDAQSDIEWVCTSGYETQITLGAGGSGDIDDRAMGGPGTLPYQLYTDSTHSAIFGDGITGDPVSITGGGYAAPDTVSVYGLVLQTDAAAAVAGVYTDTILVTIEF
jgi:spore coat protein U-like protein